MPKTIPQAKDIPDSALPTKPLRYALADIERRLFRLEQYAAQLNRMVASISGVIVFWMIASFLAFFFYGAGGR